MGMIGSLLATLFGGTRNVVRETVEVFRPNAEAQAVRDAAQSAAALAQFAAEFGHTTSAFDRLIDGLNRLPRPMLAFGTIGLFVAALFDPVWFSARMQGIKLIPEPMWWLMGAIVSFYFGARHHAKSQDFQKGLWATLARTSQVVDNIKELESLEGVEAADDEMMDFDANPALEDWRNNVRR